MAVNYYSIFGNSSSSSNGYVTKDAVEVTTTDDIQTTLDSITLLDGNVYEVRATILGVCTDFAGSIANYTLVTTAYRIGGNAIIIEGALSLHTKKISSYSLDATFTVSGNDVRASVTGLSGETWKWDTVLSYRKLSI